MYVCFSFQGCNGVACCYGCGSGGLYFQSGMWFLVNFLIPTKIFVSVFIMTIVNDSFYHVFDLCNHHCEKKHLDVVLSHKFKQ